MEQPTSIYDLLKPEMIAPYAKSLGIELNRIDADCLKREKGRILIGLKERGHTEVGTLMADVVEAVRDGTGISEPSLSETLAYMLAAEVEGMGQKVREEQASMGRG